MTLEMVLEPNRKLKASCKQYVVHRGSNAVRDFSRLTICGWDQLALEHCLYGQQKSSDKVKVKLS